MVICQTDLKLRKSFTSCPKQTDCAIYNAGDFLDRLHRFWSKMTTVKNQDGSFPWFVKWELDLCFELKHRVALEFKKLKTKLRQIDHPSSLLEDESFMK
eukprot:g48663.t1